MALIGISLFPKTYNVLLAEHALHLFKVNVYKLQYLSEKNKEINVILKIFTKGEVMFKQYSIFTYF